MSRRAIFIAVALLLASPSWAGDGKPTLLKKIANFIDTMTVSGIDTSYITMPRKPWQVMAKSNTNESMIRLRATNYELLGENSVIHWKPDIDTKVYTSLGGWIGYRGYGLGLSRTIGNGKGSGFSIGAGGSRYGISLRMRSFESDEMKFRMQGSSPIDDHEDVIEHFDSRDKMEIDDPIKIKSLLIDGFYLLNGKRFSYSAAYDQSVIQRRSAGSVMFGVSWLQTKVDYASPENGLLIIFMNDIGRIDQKQLCLGAGYAYNWVPCRNVLVNAQVMPMIAAINRIKTWTYDLYVEKSGVDEDGDPKYDLVIQPFPPEVKHSRMVVNWDAHVTLVYNSDNWFASIAGQVNHFRYSRDNTYGRMTDWYVNTSIGIRF